MSARLDQNRGPKARPRAGMATVLQVDFGVSIVLRIEAVDGMGGRSARLPLSLASRLLRASEGGNRCSGVLTN